MRINPEKKEDRERVAHSLLRATLQLANAHGFVSLGLREVARAADIAPTSFYRHFVDMEALGRELVENLAAPFIAGWVVRAGTNLNQSERLSVAIASHALAGAREDPELMRFILAERQGAIPMFRSSLAAKLASISTAVREAVVEELPDAGAQAPRLLADALVTLILDACGELLGQGPEHASEISERLGAQIHMLFTGALATGRRK